MSGWDVSSTPTWGSQDGPDETQAFKASGGGDRGHSQEIGAPEFGSGYPGESAAGGPPPEYFGQDYGQDPDLALGGYPQRTPGQSFEDLPRREAARGRHSGGLQAGGDYGQDSAFGQDWGGNGADQADHAENWGAGGQDNGSWDEGNWGRTGERSAVPWDERSHGDAGYGDAGYGDAGGGFGQRDFGRQPEGPGFSAQDYAEPDFPGQQGHGGQESMDFGYQDPDVAARNDPALQDFFAPAGGGPGFSDAGPGWPGGDTPRDRFGPGDEDADWTGRARTRPPADGDADWTGRPRRQRPPHRDDDDDSGGIGMKGLVAIGAVVVVVIAGAAYMYLHKSSSSTPTASSTPTGPASTPAAQPTGSTAKGSTGKGTGTGAGTGGASTTPAYTLVSPLPSKAGGYPLGKDPKDLANATATAKQIATAMTSGGGKLTGSPESAAYTVPASQAITFVGYQGTFTPAKVESVLKSLGTGVNKYSAGPDGGVLYCANTTATPSGAVCVWATSSTLGITEFYGATGPETLSASKYQSKGASDTVNVRADVEKKSS